MLEVKEVIKKADQGLGEAYHCEGADRNLYWIKGYSAQRDFQVNEWISGFLAKAFGVPIASFTLLELDETLYMYLPSEYKGLGYGPVFASCHAKGSRELVESLIPKVPGEVKKDLLVFDFWIQNCDRTVGNPNLLWMPETESLVVIDHNLAFNCSFDEREFFGNGPGGERAGHIFSSEKKNIFSDLAMISHYIDKIERSLAKFDDAVEKIPEEWGFDDLKCEYPATIDLAGKKKILERYAEDGFWDLK